MKFLFDLFPVMLFFVVYKLGDARQAAAHAFVSRYMTGLISDGVVSLTVAPVLLATIVAIVASVLQITYLLVRRRRIDEMLWLSVGVIVIFGSATIYFHNPDFIKWKPTILYWCFALALLVAQFGFKKNLMRSAMQEQITLPDQVWGKLCVAYILFFLLQGVLNLLVGFVLFKSDAQFGAYATFKAFGQPLIFLVFVVLQTMYLSKYVEEEKA